MFTILFFYHMSVVVGCFFVVVKTFRFTMAKINRFLKSCGKRINSGVNLLYINAKT